MFENLKKLEVTAEETAAFKIYQIEGEPTIHVSSATEVNKGYFNALLKRSRKNQRRIASGAFTADMVKENRDNDRALYPVYVIKGWDGIKDANNNLVEATTENFAEFVNALPDWLFDEIRNFATDNNSFVDDPLDIDAIAGNSL